MSHPEEAVLATLRAERDRRAALQADRHARLRHLRRLAWIGATTTLVAAMAGVGSAALGVIVWGLTLVLLSAMVHRTRPLPSAPAERLDPVDQLALDPEVPLELLRAVAEERGERQWQAVQDRVEAARRRLGGQPLTSGHLPLDRPLRHRLAGPTSLAGRPVAYANALDAWAAVTAGCPLPVHLFDADMAWCRCGTHAWATLGDAFLPPFWLVQGPPPDVTVRLPQHR